MQSLATGGQHRFVHSFAQCRVGEDDLAQGLGSRLQAMGDAKTLDLLGHFRPNHMCPQQLAAVRIENGLHKPLGLAQRQGLAVGLIVESANVQVLAAGPGRRFCQAQAGHLRTGVGAPRNKGFVQRVNPVHPGQFLDTQHPFMAGFVSQARRASDIADGVEPGDIGAAPGVCLDKPALNLHPLLRGGFMNLGHDCTPAMLGYAVMEGVRFITRTYL